MGSQTQKHKPPDASRLAAGPLAETGGRTTQSVMGHTCCCCCDHGGLVSLHDVSAAPALIWTDQLLLCSAKHGATCRLQHWILRQQNALRYTQVHMASGPAGAGCWHSVVCLLPFATTQSAASPL